jgi:hypothetical protein
LNDGLSSRSITELHLSAGTPRRLYAGTASGGVWALAVDIAVPDVDASPDSHNFGTVTEGATSNPLEITLSNLGNTTLEVSAITLSDSSNYALDVNGGTNPCGAAPFSLATSTSCTIIVSFGPQSSGDKNASLEIDSNDPDETMLNVPLTGIGVETNGNGDGDGGACFIATTAYGSYLDPHVQTLRMFRDEYLLTNTMGRKMVAYYYRYSPPIANYLKQHPSLATLTRWLLTPLVYGIAYPIAAGNIILVVMTFVMLRRWRRR